MKSSPILKMSEFVSSTPSPSCLTPVWDKACRSSTSSPFSYGGDETTATEDYSESSSSSLSLDDAFSSVATAVSPSTPSAAAASIDDSSRDLILKLLGDILQDKRRLVVQRSLELLSKLCFHHANAEQHRVFLLQAGGAVAIVQALRRFDHVALHTAAIQTLLNLSQLLAARSIIVATGGIPLLLQSLKRHRKTSFLHLCGCGVLAELACDRAAANVMVQNHGPAQIVSSMQAFPENKRLQQSACLALYRLTAIGMPHAQVAVPGSVQAVAQALETHREIPLIQQYAHLALVALLPNNNNTNHTNSIPSTSSPTNTTTSTTTTVSPNPWTTNRRHG